MEICVNSYTRRHMCKWQSSSLVSDTRGLFVQECLAPVPWTHVVCCNWWVGPWRVDLHEGRFATVAMLWLLKDENLVLQVHLRVCHGEQNTVPDPGMLVFSTSEVIALWKEEGCLGCRGSDFSSWYPEYSNSTLVAKWQSTSHTDWAWLSCRKCIVPTSPDPAWLWPRKDSQETLIYFGTSRICYRKQDDFLPRELCGNSTWHS